MWVYPPVGPYEATERLVGQGEVGVNHWDTGNILLFLTMSSNLCLRHVHAWNICFSVAFTSTQKKEIYCMSC